MLKRLSWVCCWVLLIALVGCDDKKEQAESATAANVAVLETHIERIPLENDTFKTRAGELNIVRSTPNSPPDSLQLNGKTIYKQDHVYLSLHQYITQNGRELVLVGANCAGEQCPENAATQFAFVGLQAGKDAQILSQATFSSMMDAEDVNLTVDNGKVMVDLGFEAGKRKVATLQGDQLAVTLETVAQTSLEQDDCQLLYTDVLQSCIDARENDASCADPQSWIGVELASSLTIMSNFPGFQAPNWEKYCKSGCATGNTVVDYPTFARDVCSIQNAAPLPVVAPTTNREEGEFMPAPDAGAKTPSTTPPATSQVP